jgi:hypothetical protein
LTPTATPGRTRVSSVAAAYFPLGIQLNIEAVVGGYQGQSLQVVVWFALEDGRMLASGSGDDEFSSAEGYLIGMAEIQPCCEDTAYLAENNQAIPVQVPYSQFPGSPSGYAVYPVVELRQGNQVLTTYGRADGSPLLQVGGCPSDQDCDGLADSTEQWLIDNFKPAIEFDEHEPADVLNETATLYQVSPGIHDGRRGVWITIVLLYTMDYGLTAMDVSGWDHLTCIGVGDVAAAVANAGFDAHYGDTEMLRLFVRDNGGGSWTLEGLLLKRHYDDPEYYPAGEFDRRPAGSTHVLVFASESKHGMYASADECEDYSTSYLFGACDIEIEDCGNDPTGGFMQLYTPFEHNVGERYAPIEVFGKSPALVRFSGERAWNSEEFCGGEEVIVSADIPFIDITETCGGGLSGKWLPAASYTLDVEGIASFDLPVGWQHLPLEQLGSISPAEYAPLWGR